MATKSGLISSINGYITSVVTIAKHRLSMLDLINEFFQVDVVESNLTTPAVIENNSGISFAYEVYIKKTGNTVRWRGYFNNLSGTITGYNFPLFDIIDSDYFPRTGSSFITVPCSTSEERGFTAYIEDNIFKLNASTGGVEAIYFDFSYTTNDL